MRHVRFRMIRRYLAFRPEEIRAIDEMLDRVSVGSLGHGPIQLSIHSAAVLDWTWFSDLHAWIGPGQPELHILAGPIRHYQSAIRDAWVYKVSRDLCWRETFRGGPVLDVQASQHLLVSHVRERDKGPLRRILTM